MTDEISFFFDRPIKNTMISFDDIQKNLACQTYFYAIDYLFNYLYFKENYNRLRSKYRVSIKY